MDDLDMLGRDFGFGPRGKSNPMRSNLADQPRSVSRSTADVPLFSDVFGSPPKYSSSSNSSSDSRNTKPLMSDFDHDSIFKPSEPKKDADSSNNTSSFPVYDKPVYDEDMFDGLPGLKSKPLSSTARLDDEVFASISSQPSKSRIQHADFSDLLGNLRRNEKVEESNKSGDAKSSAGSRGFDDLLGGFGVGGTANNNRPILESSWGSFSAAGSKHGSSVVDDPFAVLESTSTTGSSSTKLFTDPLEDINKFGQVRNAHSEASSSDAGAFNDLDPLSNFDNPVRSYSPERDNRGKDWSPSRSATCQPGTTRGRNGGNTSFGYSERNTEKRVHVDKFQEPPSFDMPNVLEDFRTPFGQTASSPFYDETGLQVDNEQTQQIDMIWLTVSEIPLFTQPTNAPPPSRPPPPIPSRTSKSKVGSFSSSKKKDDDFFSPSSYSQHSQSPKLTRPAAKDSPVSQFDELENFAKGLSQNSLDKGGNARSTEETNAVSAAAAMKEAMDKAEAKFKHAKEVREREYAKSVNNKESVQVEKDELNGPASVFRETQERLERDIKRKEEEEREEMRLEREREKARQAVERANREARERLAAEARERAASEARLKKERAAVHRAQAEARERAAAEAKEKAQKAAAEARERAAAAEAKERAEKDAAEARERVVAAEAKEQAEKAASEARERASAEAREKAAAEAREKEAANRAAAARAEAEARRRAERAAFERASAEARERAAAEAREKMATIAKAHQQKYDNDLDSIFGMGRTSSAPRSRETPTNKGVSEASKRAPSTSGVSSNIKKSSSTTNIVDDLSSIFGAAPSSGEFQEVEGETEERRKARMERFQRTQERAAKALAEKNQRDIQAQREQEERHRIAETLDIEIKRWAAGKEGNLRALLSTLQYVLWPECGWQPVSLTDLIAGASVKKVYRKATLYVHPDKVQQKGATLQQKYIAEKVFDLLMEAWNKFNSEELF